MTRFSVAQPSVTSPLVEHRSTRKRRAERRKSWSKEKRRAVIDTTVDHKEKINHSVLLLEQIFLPDNVVKDPNFDVEKNATCDMEKVLLREPSVCPSFACDVKKTPILREKHVGDAFCSITCEKSIQSLTDLSSLSNNGEFVEGDKNLKKHFPPNGEMKACDGVNFIERRECNKKEQSVRLPSSNRNLIEANRQAVNGKVVSNINDIVNTEINLTTNNSEQQLELANGNNSSVESEDSNATEIAQDLTFVKEKRRRPRRDDKISSEELENPASPKHYEKSRLSMINIVPNKRCRRPPQSYSPSNQHTRLKNCTITKRKHLFKDIDEEEFSNLQTTKEKDCETVLQNERVSKLKLDLKEESKTLQKKSSTKTKLDAKDDLLEKKMIDKRFNAKEKTQRIVYVLGLRQASNGERQFLVQFENGTSNWLDNEKAYEQLNVNLPVVGKYFNRNEQDISILQRLTPQWHCKNTKLFGCNDVIQTSGLCSENVTICEEEESEIRQRNSAPNKTDKKVDNNLVKNKELEITRGDNYIHIFIRHVDKRTKRINPNTCRELIEHLESYGNDNTTTAVVVSGCEDYFCSPKDLEITLKTKANHVSTMQSYDETIDVLRYLIQTIKHFPKPILATVKHSGLGLASLVLSMFDLVFDENGKESCVIDQLGNANVPFLFPKLMGLTSRSESKLMGENIKTYLNNQIERVKDSFKDTLFTSNLDATLEQIHSNSTISPDKHRRGKRFLEKTITPTTNSELGDTSEINALRLEIEKEKELSKLCMNELSTFWNDLIVASDS